MKDSGLADSPLFRTEISNEDNKTSKIERHTERKHAIVTPRMHDSMTPRYHDSMIATITKSIRETGKEVCTYRLTQKEKTALVEIIYNFRMRNCRLSENEIARIAINFLIEDFKADKEDCMLSSIIEAMKA
ncbi:MAG: hypothetical protein Q8N39_03960 [Pelolinea sp.]|nr:hypothetical protein [Pelolinea sp.]